MCVFSDSSLREREIGSEIKIYITYYQRFRFSDPVSSVFFLLNLIKVSFHLLLFH